MYYTDREVREILEQVYAEAYDAGIDDTLDYIDENYEIEDDSFDLEDEYEYYTEEVRDEMDKLMASRNYMDGSTTYFARNRKKDFTKYADKADRLGDGDKHGVRSFAVKSNGEVRKELRRGEPSSEIRQGYKVLARRGPTGKRSVYARGRIKSGANASDDPRSPKLKEAVKRNAAMQKEKLRPFKNKGNQY